MKLLGTKSKPVIGLDIGSARLRLLQLSKHGSRYRIDHFAVEALPKGSIVEKSIQDIESIADVIRKTVRNSGTRAKHAAVAVSGSAVFTKTISLPSNLAETDVESQIQLEANQYIPFPLEEVSLDFEILGKSAKNADQVDVLLAASKTENVDMRLDALEAADLSVKVVDVEAFAIANAFELIRERDGIGNGETVGIFDLGSDMTNLLALRDGRVIYTREHPFGGRQLHEDIMRRYDLNESEASFMGQGHETPEGFEEELLNPFMQNITQQISRSLQFFASSNEYRKLERVYLAGGPAILPGLADQVQDAIGIPTRVADPTAGLDVSPSVSRSVLEQNAAALMVAAGLALRGFD